MLVKPTLTAALIAGVLIGYPMLVNAEDGAWASLGSALEYRAFENADWHRACVFGEMGDGPVHLRLGIRYTVAEGQEVFRLRVRTHSEVSSSMVVTWDDGDHAYGIGAHYINQTVSPLHISGTLPSTHIRVGRQRGTNATLTFGDYGDFAVTSGELRIAVQTRPFQSIDIWSGAFAELTPIIGNELGIRYWFNDGGHIGIRFGRAFPDPSEHWSLAIAISGTFSCPHCKTILGR